MFTKHNIMQLFAISLFLLSSGVEVFNAEGNPPSGKGGKGRTKLVDTTVIAEAQAYNN